jgi:hypothetical protein
LDKLASSGNKAVAQPQTPDDAMTYPAQIKGVLQSHKCMIARLDAFFPALAGGCLVTWKNHYALCI